MAKTKPATNANAKAKAKTAKGDGGRTYHEAAETEEAASSGLSKKGYEKELARLELELIKLQEWVRHAELKVVVVFEGRDAAGKGGTIKRITQGLNPRVCRMVALAAPTERERTQW